MASEGPNYPGTAANDSAVGTLGWVNIDNVKDSDADTTYLSGSTGISYYAKVTNFSFSIPSGSTIDGIKVEISRGHGAGPGTITTSDEYVKIIKSDGTYGSTNKASSSDWGVGLSIATYGGDSDLWGETWADTDINDTDFGVVISADQYSAKGGNCYMSYIRITVYYTEGSSGYSHKVIGIASPGKVAGVANASIGKVAGT